MNIKVRVDDFPHVYDREMGRHTLDAYRSFHRALSESISGRKYILGAVPKRCIPEHLVYLRDEVDCVIGMHGTDHDENRLNRNGGNQFEPYLTANNVHRELFECRVAMESTVGRLVRTYMPPRNVIDGKTLLVLRSAGFDRFTSGPETDRAVIRDYMRMEIQSDFYGRTDELLVQGAAEALVDSAQKGLPSVLTLHWTWEHNVGLDHLKRFFERIPSKLIVDFDEYD